MEKVKRDAASFSKLSAMQMKKIDGGGWIEIKNPDGSSTTIWV